VETRIQIDDELLADAQRYAQRTQQSISQVISEALRAKLTDGRPPSSPAPHELKDTPALHPDVMKITGLVPADFPVEERVFKRRLERHR
jgi:hypothetical protein